MKTLQHASSLLRDGLAELKVPDAYEKLMAYLSLLDKWNRAYNLTSVRDLPAMVSRHVLDSLAISPFIYGSRIIDVGSGAGLPGIPLAITHPNHQFVLLDSNGKKTRFLDEVKRSLGLNNVEVVQSRAENYHPSAAFDTVISRAFSDLAQMLNWTTHLIAENGIWLAMKGKYPQTELDMITNPSRVHPYRVPGLEEERCSVIIDNVTKE